MSVTPARFPAALPPSVAQHWRALIAEFGSPLAAYDLETVRRQCRALKRAFSFCDPFFSVKANHNPALLQAILAEGFGVDAVSPNEAALALRCGAAPDQVIYVENNMTDAEMAWAAEKGVRLAIGSLSRLGKYARAYPRSKVGIRINADVGGAHHARTFTAGPDSKFGIHFTQAEAALDFAAQHGVKITLLQQHIGSGWLEESSFREAVEILLREAQKFPDLDIIDFGGGFGVPYRAGDKQLSLEEMAQWLRKRLDLFEAEQGRAYAYAIEPGRYIVAECGVLLATVQDKKSGSDGREFLGLDTGFNHLMRPALYGSVHEIVNLSRPDAPPKPYDICGNICESTDFFARGREIPEAQEGDVLAILHYGAYGAAMSNAYNLRPPAPEVLIDGDKFTLTRERASLDTLMAGYKLP
ncbi:MAG: diaminopimelate decarboxylase [Hyphomonadaceae bacterium]|nr:diaminopimelate decarboxylase [Hyphomonadaceae bacterium]